MKTEITIFTTNDIHGRFLEEQGAIDFSKLATLKARTPNSLLVDAGDATQGTPFAILHKGLDAITVMNAVGYDLLTVGNHEFDNITRDNNDSKELDDIIQSFNGTYLACNLLKKGTDENYIASLNKGNGCYCVKKIGEKNLLFIGITTSKMSMNIARMTDFAIQNVVNSVKLIASAVDKAKNAHGKIHGIIIISHLGKSEMPETSFDLATALKKKGLSVNLIIDGHSHDECNRIAGGTDTLIVQSVCYGKYFSQITLTFDGEKLSVTSIQKDKDALSGEAKDPIVRKLLDDMKDRLDQKFGHVWSSGAECTLWGGVLEESKPFVVDAINIARYAETNLGYLVADAMIETIRIKKQEFNNAIAKKQDKIKDCEYIVGTINGGGLRDSIAFDKPIRSYELYTVMPSHIESEKEAGFSIFRITLADLKIILENSVSKIAYKNGLLETSDGRFLNIAGLSFKIIKGTDDTLKIDNKITLCRMIDYSSTVTTYDLEKDKAKTILFGAVKYISGGGDGYTLLKDKTAIASTSTALFQLTGEYIYRQTKGGKLQFPSVIKTIEYDDSFKFSDPTEFQITLTDKDGKNLSNDNILLKFDTGDKGDTYRILTSDEHGQITVTPPKGNSVLKLCHMNAYCQMPKEKKLYCELYFHTYYIEHKNIAACLVPRSIDFKDLQLATFKHGSLSSTGVHYSNYVNYLDWESNDGSFLILNGKIYARSGQKEEFKVTEAVQYLSDTNEKKVFQFTHQYKTWDSGKHKATILFY